MIAKSDGGNKIVRFQFILVLIFAAQLSAAIPGSWPNNAAMAQSGSTLQNLPMSFVDQERSDAKRVLYRGQAKRAKGLLQQAKRGRIVGKANAGQIIIKGKVIYGFASREAKDAEIAKLEKELAEFEAILRADFINLPRLNEKLLAVGRIGSFGDHSFYLFEILDEQTAVVRILKEYLIFEIETKDLVEGQSLKTTRDEFYKVTGLQTYETAKGDRTKAYVLTRFNIKPFMEQAQIQKAYRTWQDKSGKFNVRGKYLSLKGGKVAIEKENGEQITVSLKRLSTADAAFVKDKQEPPPKKGKK